MGAAELWQHLLPGACSTGKPAGLTQQKKAVQGWSPAAGQAKPQVAAPAQPTQANWLSCNNLILNPSPKSTGDEDQKYPIAWFSELVVWALYPKVLESSCICASLRPLQAEEVGTWGVPQCSAG